jgi:diguanylate cyclase (GGDEF)-like protein
MAMDPVFHILEPNSEDQQDFFEDNADLLRDLDNTWRETIRGEWNASAINRMRFLLHRLIGTCQAMGYKQTELAARNLKAALEETEVFQQARERVQEIEIEFETLWQVLRTEKPAAADNADEKDLLADAQSTAGNERKHQLIYLAEDDIFQAEKLAAQIGYFGYQLQTFSSPADLKAAVQQKPPQAILMDVIFPESHTGGLDAAQEIISEWPHIPVLFMSAEDSMDMRLQAVKVGGMAFFPKPVNISSLIDTLDHFTGDEDRLNPYRVLLIEDSRFQATFYAKKLQNAGIDTRILTNPMEITATLQDFHPDLILLDMYMPVATGMELARLIRQIETYLSIPIVYLSAETDKDKQLQAMKLGGDDFLDKSMKPEHLISSVTTRAARYRELRALMVRDGLTGLFNHSTVKERLEQEVLYADRTQQPMAYVMIDIDRFKSVNDTYGHAAGDRVLKSLSRLLVQRLRRTDVIGRYGGEEFAIILPNTPIVNAVRVMEELRQGFASLSHQAEDQEFSVTFSCGIASQAKFKTAGLLSEAADKALYLAKKQGRNQTICADFLKS